MGIRRLTVGQAIVEFLVAQQSERDGGRALLARRAERPQLAAVECEREIVAVRTDAGSISMATRERMSDPLLRASVRVRAGLALGVVFVMTTKPDALGAAVAVAVFGVLGLATLLLGGRAGSANDATRAVAAGRAGR